MKRKLQIIVGASAASVLACSALAQENLNTKTDRADYAHHDRMHESRADQLNGAAKASDVIGMTVQNNQNEKLGTVEDLAVDVESGRIVQVILSTGGFLGIGDSLTAVPPGALRHDDANQVLHLDADKEKLAGAPKFDDSKWAVCCDSNHLAAVYDYYGRNSDFTFIHKGDAVLDGLRDPNGRVIREGQRANDLNRDQNGRVTQEGQRASDLNRDADETRKQDRRSNKNQSMIQASRLGQVQKASEILDMSVRNPRNEEMGDVENILLDLPSGRIVAIILSSGGFLGIGDELSAVPPTALRFNSDRSHLQLDASKEMMSNAPHFQAGQWPDFRQPSYADGIYRAYDVEPYFTTNTTTSADNMKRSDRDRDGRALTPLEQGKGEADLATTAQIRKEVQAGKNMSINAKNVRIITSDGRVTLRGPVNTAEEKRLIGEIANRIARSENVDNQLEVKLTTSSNK